MSEEFETTQPNKPADTNSTKKMKPYKADDTQPRKSVKAKEQQPVEEPKPVEEEPQPVMQEPQPDEEEPQPVMQEPQPDVEEPQQPVKKTSRWKSILTGVFGFLLLIGLGGFGGYSSGVGARENAEGAIMVQQLSEQFSFALVDIEFKRYENARQRLEYIIQRDPSFPGVQEKLTEVLVLSSGSNIPAPAAEATATATPDFSGAENAYARAQELIRAQDWNGALTALDTVRKFDPNYKAAQVDGMYYFALRNKGHDLITKEGNLEGGIYYITLAERFGPLDNTARGLRDGARAYMVGASFWELDWEQAMNNFAQVAAGWPSMWDGTMTASQRYVIASVRFADDLFIAQAFCEAYDQYTNAAAVGALDANALANQAQAFANCFPATEAPSVEVPVTEAPTQAPTDAPTEAPTDVVPTSTP